jgi:regulator of sigma D
MSGNETEPSPERRQRTRQLVETLLREREQLLVLYCRVAGLEPYHRHRGEHLASLLRDFCQITVDYVAAVEFELFSRLSAGRERRQDVLRTAEACYPGISSSDDVVLAFNDKYESLDEARLLETLPGDLSRLGDTLAERFELEDRMFQALR